MSKPKKKSTNPPSKEGGVDATEKEIMRIKQEIEAETRARDTMEWTNMELERSVRVMERGVQQLELGNFETDDSEQKQKFEGQKQINIQLQEQKKWLEHELDEIKMKIQNDKMNQVPDMLLDWDKLSETELKRLVSQLEKTRNDLRSDISDVEYRLDKEGKEYHHHEDFAQMYRAEVKSLTRTLDQLQRHGAQLGVPLPGLPGSGSNLKDTPLNLSNSESHTPGGWMSGSYPMSRKHSELIAAISPPPSRKLSSSPPPNRKNMSQSSSPTRRVSTNPPSPTRKLSISPTRKMPVSPTKKLPEEGTKTKMNPKLGTQRKTAGVRNLPKIDSSRKKEKDSRKSRAKSKEKVVENGNGIHGNENEDSDVSSQDNVSQASSTKSADSSRQSAVSSATDLNTVREEDKEEQN